MAHRGQMLVMVPDDANQPSRHAGSLVPYCRVCCFAARTQMAKGPVMGRRSLLYSPAGQQSYRLTAHGRFEKDIGWPTNSDRVPSLATYRPCSPSYQLTDFLGTHPHTCTHAHTHIRTPTPPTHTRQHPQVDPKPAAPPSRTPTLVPMVGPNLRGLPPGAAPAAQQMQLPASLPGLPGVQLPASVLCLPGVQLPPPLQQLRTRQVPYQQLGATGAGSCSWSSCSATNVPSAAAAAAASAARAAGATVPAAAAAAGGAHAAAPTIWGGGWRMQSCGAGSLERESW